MFNMETAMKASLKRILGPGLSVVLFSAAVWLLHRQLQTYHFNDIMSSLQAIPISRIWKAFGLTLASYGVMTGYDALALRYIQHPLTYFKIALASFIGYTFSNNIGLSMIAGGLGGFETVVVLLLSSRLPAPRILGALLIYRALYYWMPLVAAALMLGIQEILRKRRVARRIAELFEQWVSPIIPQVLAVTVFVGVALQPAFQCRLDRRDHHRVELLYLAWFLRVPARGIRR
jgi:uncharacterized membrane protein YbhN (UPF0104 family)